jgi:cytidylate kinase
VGRCGNYILRDRPNTVHVFVYGEEEQRLKRAIQDYGLDKDEAKKMLNQVDKGRSNYYRNFTGEKYGQKESFDLMINSSTMGVDGTVNILCSYAQYICADDEL